MPERERFKCRFCRRVFYTVPTEADPEPTACGRKICFEKGNWTQADWDGAARMADARQSVEYSIEIVSVAIDAAGVKHRSYARVPNCNEISELDRIALKRRAP